MTHCCMRHVPFDLCTVTPRYALSTTLSFEHLAMELLGQCLGDIPHNVLKEIVPQEALQMVRASIS
jgi:hypothetical protein